MDRWVGHIGWPIADGLTTNWSPVQLAVWRRIWNVRRPRHSYFTPSPNLVGGALSDDVVWRLSVWCASVCLSVAYIGPMSRTERPKKIQVGTVLADITRDSDTYFKFKRSKSPGRFTHRDLNAWCRCSDDHGDVLGAGIYCYVASARRHVNDFVAHGGSRGAGVYRVSTRTACC